MVYTKQQPQKGTMMERFFKTFSLLPFAGKFAIGKEMFEVYVATTPRLRSKEYRDAVILLIIMIAAHALQAKMGYEAFVANVPIYAKAYFLIYGLVNVTVSLTQTWLLWRVSDFHFTQPLAKGQRRGFKAKPEQVTTAIVFTLAGQSIFLALRSIFI